MDDQIEHLNGEVEEEKDSDVEEPGDIKEPNQEMKGGIEEINVKGDKLVSEKDENDNTESNNKE